MSTEAALRVPDHGRPARWARRSCLSFGLAALCGCGHPDAGSVSIEIERGSTELIRPGDPEASGVDPVPIGASGVTDAPERASPP